jgi:hypothetical protein
LRQCARRWKKDETKDDHTLNSLGDAQLEFTNLPHFTLLFYVFIFVILLVTFLELTALAQNLPYRHLAYQRISSYHSP